MIHTRHEIAFSSVPSVGSALLHGALFLAASAENRQKASSVPENGSSAPRIQKSQAGAFHT
jgi:hypothetical protein